MRDSLAAKASSALVRLLVRGLSRASTAEASCYHQSEGKKRSLGILISCAPFQAFQPLSRPECPGQPEALFLCNKYQNFPDGQDVQGFHALVLVPKDDVES